MAIKMVYLYYMGVVHVVSSQVLQSVIQRFTVS